MKKTTKLSLLICIVFLFFTLMFTACNLPTKQTPPDNDDTTQQPSPDTQEKDDDQKEEDTPKEPSHKPPAELTDVTSIRLKNLMTNEERTLEADKIELLLSKWKQVEWADGMTKTGFEYCFIVNEDIVIYYEPWYCLFEDRENKVFYGMSFEYGNTEEMEWEAAKFASNFLPEIFNPDAFE
jgi:hypothetical protein